MNKIVPIDSSQIAEYENQIARNSSFLTIGGCSTDQIGKRISRFRLEREDHLWRRPTISLVSKPISKSRFNFSGIPAEFSNYFINDILGIHLDELMSYKSNILIFDLTRDTNMGVIDLGEGSYIMNPADAIGMIDGLDQDNTNEDRLKEVLNIERLKFISIDKDRDEFIDLWKKSFDLFMKIASEKFRSIFLLKLYYTKKANAEQYFAYTNDFKYDIKNEMLDEMYEYAEKFDLKVISISRTHFITGLDVEMGGPSPTHYIDETYELFAEKLNYALLGESFVPSRNFIPQAFKRAREAASQQFKNQELQQELDGANARHATLVAERDELARCQADTQARLDDVLRQLGDAVASRDAVAQKLAEMQAERDDLARRYGDALADHDALAAKHAELAERHDALVRQQNAHGGEPAPSPALALAG